MSRRIVFINAVLLVAIALSAYQLVISWDQFQQQSNLEEVVRRAGAEAGLPQEDVSQLLGEERLVHDFFVIAERNLFREERRPPEEDPDAEAVVEAPEFPRRPEMLGTTEADGESQALLKVFSTARSQGDTRTVALGDSVQGYVVSDMTPTTVTLAWNDVREVIDMFAAETGSQPQAGSAKQLAAVKIIRIGSSHSAVESTGAEESDREEGRGLQVSAVGGQRTGRQGVSGRAGTAAGARGGIAGSRGGFSGSASNFSRSQGSSGLVGGSRNPVPRPRN